MQSFKLLKQLFPFIQMRWKLTGIAYFCLLLGLSAVLLQPLLFSYLIDEVLIAQKTALIQPLLLAFIGLTVVSVSATLIRSVLFRYLCIENILDLRKVLTKHIRSISIYKIEKEGAGKYSALLGMDTSLMGTFVNHVLVEMLSRIFMAAAALTMLFVLNWKLAVMTAACIPLLLSIPHLLRKPMLLYSRHVRSHNEQIGTYLIESIEGSKEIRAFGLEQWEERRNEEMYKGLVRSSTRESMMQALSGQLSILPISLILVLMYWIGSGQVLQETMSIGVLVAAVTYLQSALNPVKDMNQYFGDIQKTEVALQRIVSFLQSPKEEAAREERAAYDAASAASIMERLAIDETPAVVCANLHAVYERVSVLKNVSFTVMKGQTAAFVGRSGSGKSTLYKILMGFSPYQDGHIAINGISMKELRRQDLLSQVGIVFQEPFLFRGSLLENIRLGKLDATDDEIDEVIQRARLHELVSSLPDGLHTQLDHKGFQLSGGQKQRISIARAMLQKSPLLLLDEPTSALDQETEREVLEALQELAKGKTTLISTHRLNTIRHADVIYMMNNGVIVESGNHQQLMQLRGDYYEMVVNGYSAENEERQSLEVGV